VIGDHHTHDIEEELAAGQRNAGQPRSWAAMRNGVVV
jgi:hypothetical protein